MPCKDADQLLAKLKSVSGREFYVGELEGKHSETRLSGQELLDALTVIEETPRVSAFSTLYGEMAQSVPGHPEWRWIGSYDVIDSLEEAMQYDSED